MYVRYYCSHCDEDFSDKYECLEHEDTCTCNPENPKAPTNHACDTCEHCTAEGYFAHECKMKFHKLPRLHCADHQPARQ